MSQQVIKDAIAGEKMKCPECKKPIKQYDKYIDMIASVWDGPGDSRL